MLSLSGNQIEKIEGSRGSHYTLVVDLDYVCIYVFLNVYKYAFNFADTKGPINLILNDMVIEGKSLLLESLGALPTLKTLDLSWSNLRGTIIGEGNSLVSN